MTFTRSLRACRGLLGSSARLRPIAPLRRRCLTTGENNDNTAPKAGLSQAGPSSTISPVPSTPSAVRPSGEKQEVPSSETGGHLAKILRDSIRITGPFPISRYMQFCLSHPTEGYYAQGDVFGAKGDFITSPEISQIFGELVAIWLLTRYMAAGSPKRCRIVELGPGRGTLMEDVLRTLSTFPAIASSIKEIYLVENSEKMQKLQSDKLAPRCEPRGIQLHWNDRLEDVPASDDFTMLIAHEFFDAMPINLFEKTEEGYREVLVDLHPAFSPGLPTESPGSGLRLAISRESTPLSTVLSASSPRFAALPVGTRIEVSQDSYKIMRKVGELLSSGGAGLVVDYGDDKVFGSSFRAFRQHKIVDIFDRPGSSDLTANVDFKYLQEALAGTGTTALGPIAQSEFLISLGMAPRLQKLLDSAGSPERRADIALAVKRLIDPLGMGGQYKIMGLSAGATGEVYPFPVEQSDEPTPTEEVQGDSEQPSAATSKRPSSEVQ